MYRNAVTSTLQKKTQNIPKKLEPGYHPMYLSYIENKRYFIFDTNRLNISRKNF